MRTQTSRIFFPQHIDPQYQRGKNHGCIKDCWLCFRRGIQGQPNIVAADDTGTGSQYRHHKGKTSMTMCKVCRRIVRVGIPKHVRGQGPNPTACASSGIDRPTPTPWPKHNPFLHVATSHPAVLSRLYRHDMHTCGHSLRSCSLMHNSGSMSSQP